MMQMILSTKGIHRLREQTYGCQGEGQGQAIAGELDINMHTLLYFKRIANKILLYSTGNSAQSYVAGWTGREFGRQSIHVYVCLSPFTVPRNYHNMVHQPYPNTKSF